ncbi:hypothetical protein KO507_03455 [Gilvimarinus agarilyticus]|nr:MULTISPECIES: ATP-binding protein [Reichenbachiella]MBU2884819.1 hypothetical protein [Gilvimarinus agarilyticus]MBU2912989.1 hypothetical protein [Reichenbachiella agariperforans]
MNDLLLDNDSERKKIIHELHENIGNKIVAAKMQFGSLPHPEILNSNPYVQGHLLLDQVVNDTRQLAYGMSDKELSEFNIMKSLKHIKHTLEQEGKIKLGIYFHGLDKTLSHELNLRLFRMIQELITNTLTHAYASQITVQLNRNDQELILTVEDNGIGFDPRQVNFIRGNGIGLKEIERNLNQIAGSVFIDSTPGHGTTITIQIPLAA